MGFNCGIVGLPNVGKSTLFNALTNAGALAANYPFCTIDPNIGVVPVPDPRLNQIAAIFKPKKIIPTTVEFVDIAGLVAGASKGEGLGNKFLGHIKAVDAIAHVVRCFEDPDVVHVHGDVDPVRDIEVVNTELILTDLQAVTNRIDKTKRLAKVGDKKSQEALAFYEKMEAALNNGKPIRSLTFTEAELELTRDFFFLTQKPVLTVCNVSEKDLGKEVEAVKKVKEYAVKENAAVVAICGTLEAEIIQMPEAEKTAFLADYGLKESGLDAMAHQGYRLLNLITYFTAGPDEVRAWTIVKGTLAPQAAGVIHSDFERGFICADIYHFDDLIKQGTEPKVKAAGLLRQEGKTYEVKDGDIIHFKFNV